MGDESPEQAEVVCTACGETFHRGGESEEPFLEVECPHCGESTVMTGQTTAKVDAPPADEKLDAPTRAEEGPVAAPQDEAESPEAGFETAQPETEMLDTGAPDGESGDGSFAGDPPETAKLDAEETELQADEEPTDEDARAPFEGDAPETARVDSVRENDFIEAEDTAEDQETIERAREKSREIREQSAEGEEESSDVSPKKTVDAGLDELSDGEFSSLEDLQEASSDAVADEEGDDEERSSGDSELEGAEDESSGGSEEEQGFGDEVHERETAVSRTPLSERSDVDDLLEGDSTSNDGQAREDDVEDPDRTPAAGLDRAIEDSVAPELGEETAAAIGEAVEESLDSSSNDSSEEDGADEDSEGLGEGSVPSPREALGDAELSDERDAGESSTEASTESEERRGPPGPPPVPETEEASGDEGEIERNEEAGEEEATSAFDLVEEEEEMGGAEEDEGGEEAEDEPLSAEELLTGEESSEADVVEEPPDEPSEEEVGTEESEPTDAGANDDRDPDAAVVDEPSEREPEEDDQTSPAAESQRASPETGVDQTQETPERSSNLLFGVVAVAVAAAAVVVLFNPGGLLPETIAVFPSNRTEAGTSSGGPFPTGTSKAAEMGPAVSAARKHLHEALQVDPSDPELQRSVAKRLVDAGRYVEASRIYGHLWRDRRDDAEFAQKYLRVLTDAKRHARARHVAVEALQATDRDELFREKFLATLDNDPELQSYESVTIGELSGVQKLRPVEELDLEGYVLEGLTGKPRFIFAPADSDKREWRDDVAAWRLCEIISCGFEIPRTRPARIARSRFEKLFEESAGDLGNATSELHWVERKGLDGTKRTYVYGSLRDWPGELARWPIEQTDIWRDWLSIYSDPGELDKPLDEALSEFEAVGDGSLYREILDASRGESTRSMAAGLSRVVNFDFLVNNWGRFAEEESEYGSRNHYGNGRFVTIQTGTVFQRRSSTRVKGRFHWVSRFSRDFVDSVRLLERDTVSPLLYPDPAWYEEGKLEIFWKQRERFLERVDELVADEGRDDVLLFE